MEGDPVPPVDAGLSVVTEVIRTIELGEGGGAGWGETKEVPGAEILGEGTPDGLAGGVEGGKG